MKDTKSPQQDETINSNAEFARGQYRMAARYHAELARFSTWIFSGIIISITFLLLAGLRNPHTLLLIFMYVALGCFSLTVLLYPLVNHWGAQLIAKTAYLESLTSKDKATLDAAKKAKAQLSSRLKALQYTQQALFVIGALAALGFAIEVSTYLFATPTAAPAGQAG
jgi:hypothetical protein